MPIRRSLPPDAPTVAAPGGRRGSGARTRRPLLGLVLAGALLGWLVREIFEQAAAPPMPKACAYVFPDLPGGGKPVALVLPAAPVGLPLLQRGGTLRDASCLDRTAVAGVVGVRNADDVAATLRWASAAGLKVTAAGERHSMGGQSFVRNGVVLDMHGMHGMSLDRKAHLLTVESGARWSEVQRFLDGQGFAVKAMQSINIFTVGGTTALPHARQDSFGFVLYFNQRLGDHASRVLEATTRDLIDLTLGLGGTFYLPYRLYYSGEQLRRAYPGFDDLIRLKWQYDPGELFTNEMFEKYKPHRPAAA